MFAGLLASALLARATGNGWSRSSPPAPWPRSGVGAYMGLVVLPTLNPSLKAYWASQYLSGTPHRRRARRRGTGSHQIHGQLAMPVPVFILLFLAGIAVLLS